MSQEISYALQAKKNSFRRIPKKELNCLRRNILTRRAFIMKDRYWGAISGKNDDPYPDIIGEDLANHKLKGMIYGK